MSEETINSTETTAGNNSERTNAGRGMGVVALVLGILSVICSFISCFSFEAILFGALAILFGAIGMSQVGKKNKKKGLPKAGLILGIIGTLIALIWWFMFAGEIAASLGKLLNAVNN
jgi:hypothetical protein